MAVREFDVVVVGAGAVGENVADRASRTGLDVALVDAALVGGECSYWACMPSKALLRPGDAVAAARAVPGVQVGDQLDVAAVLARRDQVAARWDDSGQVAWVEGAGLTLLRGHARLTGERELVVTAADGEVQVRARCAVVLATGSVAVVPEALAEARPWTSREATSAQHVPARLAVVGGGVVAVEMATAYADLGAQVELLVRGDRLLPHAEPFAAEAVRAALVGSGVQVSIGARVSAARREDDGVHLRVEHRTGPGDGAVGDREVVVDEVLAATGRRPRTADLGVERMGLEPGRALEVDDALQVTGVPGGWLFAAGDVTGRTATTHQGKYDARVVGDVLAARFEGRGSGTVDPDRVPLGVTWSAEERAGAWSRFRATADLTAVPQVVFSRPQVAWVGMTEEDARRAGVEVDVVGYELGDVAGATVTAQGYAGRAQVLVDRRRGVLVGATFVGPDVSEMLHAATVAVVGEVSLDRLWHAVPAYPTVSEVWLRLLETAGY